MIQNLNADIQSENKKSFGMNLSCPKIYTAAKNYWKIPPPNSIRPGGLNGVGVYWRGSISVSLLEGGPLEEIRFYICLELMTMNF